MPYLRRFQTSTCLTLAVLLSLSALAGCHGSGSSGDTPDATQSVSDPPAQATNAAAGVADDPASQPASPADDAGAASTCAGTGTSFQSQMQFLASNPGVDDRFSSAIAMSGDTIAIGAENEDSKASGLDGDQDDNSVFNAGAVYLWECHDGVWRQTHYLKATDAAQSDHFGSSLALSGDTLLVGAKGRTVGDQSFAGAVFVYRKSQDGWRNVALLTEPTLSAGARYGFSVAMSGDIAVVGAPGENGNAGKLFFYRRDGDNWIREDAVAGAGGAYLGRSLALSGETVVTSSLDAALVYQRGARGDGSYGWTQRAALTGTQLLNGLESKVEFDATASVAMTADRIVVTSPAASAMSAANAGRACAFKPTGAEWIADGYCFGPTAPAYQLEGMLFGQSGAVILDNGKVVVTADGDSSAGVAGHGSVFVFAQSGGAWVQEQNILSPAGLQQEGKFGFTGIAAAGNSFIVSELLHTGTQALQGAAYLFGAR